MADRKISELVALTSAVSANDALAIVDNSAAQTKKIDPKTLLEESVKIIGAGTIPADKISGVTVPDGSVTTAKLADRAVTAEKLDDNSSGVVSAGLPAAGIRVGQVAVDTTDNKFYIWSGSQWLAAKGAGSVNEIVGDTTGPILIGTTATGDSVTLDGSIEPTANPAEFLAGPTSGGGAVTARQIIGADLPDATSSSKGAVSVPGNGLTVNTGALAIDNTVAPNSSAQLHVVEYNEFGLIVSGRTIQGGDLPYAQPGVGGVIKPGTGLSVDADGNLNHTNVVSNGVGTKITFDGQGHVTGTAFLDPVDIPSLDASKIASGALPSARIEDNAVTGAKVGDYAVSKFGEVQPTADHIGQFFFNPLTRDLFLWDGNVFQPVGISAGEIVLAGTYDASSNLLDSVTAEGSAAGFTNGASLPAADTGNNRYYVVVSQTGTGTAPAPTVTLEPPDILLSNGTSYVLIETSETITAQIASNVGFTPYGDIASTNVQGAIAELDDEKVSLAGDTMTGDLTLGAGVDLVYEGTSDNNFETTLTVADPTADNTVTIPNETGTVVTTGSSGVVTSTMITDGTIVNADISSSAEIAVSKLADGAARQLLQTNAAGTGVEWANDIDIPGTLDVTGAATFDGTASHPLGSASAPAIAFTGDTNTGLYSPGADQVAISTAGTGRLFVASDGMVGIGTNAPVQQTGNGLHINNSLGQTRIKLTNSITGATANDGFDIIQETDAVGSVHLFNHENAPLKFGTNGTERLRLTSDGKLGLGTSGPGFKLTIQDSTTPRIRIGDGVRHVNLDGGSATQNAAVGTDYAGSFGIYTNGATNTRLHIDSAGLVGIGTTSPGEELQIGSTSSVSSTSPVTLSLGGQYTPQASISLSNLKLKVYDGSTDSAGFTAGQDGLSYVAAKNGQHIWYRADGAGTLFESFRSDASGRLLVGTSSASLSNKFALQGDTSSANNGGYMRLRTGNSIVSGTSLGSIGFGDAANNGALIEAKGDVSWSPFTKGSRIEFSTTADGASTPTERMRIAQNGGIGIGNISADYAGGVYATSVKLTLHSEASVNNVNVPLEIYNGPSTSTRYSAIFSNGNGIVGSISTTGSATTYSTSSDYRLKENVIPLTGAADRLNQLQVCRFNFIADPDNTVDGFIAHEAQAVVPEAVTGTHDEVDADGNPVYQGIDQSKLVPLLTAALQEALQKIETLEQRLNDAGIA